MSYYPFYKNITFWAFFQQKKLYNDINLSRGICIPFQQFHCFNVILFLKRIYRKMWHIITPQICPTCGCKYIALKNLKVKIA